MVELTRRSFIAATATAAIVAPLRAGAQGTAKKPVLRIGVLTDMSGPYHDVTGSSSVACARQAVQDFASGQFDVEILTGDHQNKPDLGAGIARQWFDQDGVEMILDVPNSSVAFAVSHLAKEKNKAYVNCGGASSDLTGKSCTPNLVHWSYDTYMQAATVGLAATRSGSNKWFFITTDNAGARQLQEDTTGVVVKAGGKIVGSALYPLSTTDFSSFILQAQSSGANIIGLSNSGDDTVNCVKQIHEFAITATGVKIAALLGSVTTARGMGMDIAEGLIMCESFYWDLDEHTRAFAKRVSGKMAGSMPNAINAGCYAGTLHYLKAVTDLGIGQKGDGAGVIARMKAMPAEDDCFGKTVIRADGRAMVTPYLLQVKKPSESKGEWDLFKVVSSVAPEEAALPVSACPLVKA